MKTEPLILERIYHAPIGKVWKAITNKDQMKQWYFDIHEFKAEKGFEFEFTCIDNGEVYLHRCKILVCEAPHIISYTWTYPAFKGTSVVTWELLSEAENRTLLRLTHTGLESFPQENPNFRIDSFTAGWNHFLNEALPSYVETSVVERSSSN